MMKLMTLTWTGMVLFFVFGLFTLVTDSDIAPLLMLVSLGIWVISGIVAARKNRTSQAERGLNQ